MRIGIFTDTYMPHVNGVAVSTDILFRELKKTPHNVWLFCPTMPGYEKGDCDIFRLQSVKFPFYPGHRMTYELWGLERKVKNLRLDIIHSQTPFFIGLAANSIHKHLGIPMVHCYHTVFESYLHYAPILPKKTALSFTEKFSRYYCNQSALVVAPSQGIKELLIKYGVESRIEVLPTGIEFDLFKNAPKGEFKKGFNIPEDKRVLVYAGRLGYEKNIDFLIKAFKELLSIMSNTVLMIVGDGPYRNDLENLVGHLGLKKEVVFTGSFTRDKVARAFKDSEIFIFASKTETQGLVILEAMAAGLATVAIDAVGVRDVVADGKVGFLCKEDTSEFSQKIKTLLEDRLLRENFSKNAQGHAQNFSSANFALKMLSFYNDVLKK